MSIIPTKMEWLSYFGHRRPINGQKIFYFGEMIGVWRGTYSLDWNDPVSPHRMICSESPGMVDRMDAPWWMPDEGQPKPERPAKDYPKDYPGWDNHD